MGCAAVLIGRRGGMYWIAVNKMLAHQAVFSGLMDSGSGAPMLGRPEPVAWSGSDP